MRTKLVENNPVKLVVLLPVFLYRRVISPALPRRCKYEPSCSRYTIEAVRRCGLLRGSVLAIWRLLRCNPLSHGGFDPVETSHLFKRQAGNRR